MAYPEAELRKLYRELVFTRLVAGADYRSMSWFRFEALLREEEQRVEALHDVDWRPQLGDHAHAPLADSREEVLTTLAAGEAHLASGEFKQGEELFRTLCRSNQHLAVALVGLARCLLGEDGSRNHDVIVALLEQTLEQSPNDVAAAELLRSVLKSY
jgi:hypothetical protein